VSRRLPLRNKRRRKTYQKNGVFGILAVFYLSENMQVDDSKLWKNHSTPAASTISSLNLILPETAKLGLWPLDYVPTLCPIHSPLFWRMGGIPQKPKDKFIRSED
jgi:hypothetical protein